MNKINIVFLVICWCSQSQQLQQKIGTNPTIISSSAALEVESTTKGLLPPRMTNQQMTAIVNPATGLLVYCTNCSPTGFRVYNGSAWADLGSGGGSSPTVVVDCNVNGFSGNYINGFSTAGTSFSTTIINNSLCVIGPVTLAAGDLVLSGVAGLTVGTPSPSSITINPGASQLITYPISGTPATTGTLTGIWNKSSLSCSDTQSVIGLTTALNDLNYCTNASVNGMYINGNALTTSNTFTVTITNNSGSNINGFPAPTVGNLNPTWSGTGNINVASVSPSTAFSVANGASQTITYILSGTPTGIGTLTLDWSYGDLTCQKVKNIGLGDATLSLPVVSNVVSICQGANCSQINIQGVMDNSTNKKIVNVAYTGGLGSYSAYTSGWIANNSGTGEGGDSNSFRISYPAGTFNASGTLPLTIEVDGDGSFNTLKITPGSSYLVATIPININGNFKGSVSIKIISCGAPTNTGGFLVFKCHNLGADESADPFSPSWKLNGAYIQWGKRGPTTNWATAVSDGTLGFAAAPTGPGADEANDAAVANWSASTAVNGAWNVTELSAVKTANDPCPNGYRVPTRNEWLSIYSTSPINTQNNWSNVGTFSYSITNYSSGKNVNNSLYLPTSGFRVGSTGLLVWRGVEGEYWSSTVNGDQAAIIVFTNNLINPEFLSTRLLGFSVRCIAE